MTAVAAHDLRVSARLADAPARPLLVELIGPAGAGKTTLVRAIVGQTPGARPGLTLHRVRDLPAVAVAAGQILPALMSALRQRSGTVADDARYSLRLLAHRAPATRVLRSGARIVLVDEGPVYMLARLIAFGSAGVEGSEFAHRWERELEWWRERLDAVVWLDAPDETLAARIRGRAKAHRAKHSTDAALTEFLARYRRSYATVVGRLTAHGGPRVIRLDGRDPVSSQVDRLLTALRVASGQRAGVGAT